MAFRHWALVLLLGSGWGASFLFNTILLRELEPLSIAMLRLMLGAAGCWLFLAAAGRRVRLLAGRLPLLLLFGLITYAGPLICYAVGQQYIATGVAGVINGSTPALTVLLAHVWPGGERAALHKAGGVAAGFAGVAVMSWPLLQAGGATQGWAILVFMGAPLCHAVGINMARSFRDPDPVVLVALALTAALPVVAPMALMMEGPPVITRTDTALALGFNGLVLTGGFYIILYWLLPQIGPANLSVATLVAPVVALILGVWLLQEDFLPAHAAGLAAILLGMLLIDGRILRRRAPPEAAG
jgi:drug/metabolite transporter (DMT)-like permease